MTRINVVPVSTLHRLHLHAEYKELPAVFTMVKKRLERGKRIPTPPDEYSLNAGHMLFFADKLGWLSRRYREICKRLTEEFGYNLKPRDLLYEFASIPAVYWSVDYEPSPVAIERNLARINERLADMQRRGVE